MADYTGVEITISESENLFYGLNLWPLQNRFGIQSSTVYADSYAFELKHGGVCEVWYGCDAGDVTISVYVYPPEAGKVYMRIIDPDTREIQAEASASGSGAWEKIEANFTALKKVYLVQLINPCKYENGEKRAYFDNLG